MDTTANRPSPAFRIALIAGSLAVLGIWAWSWTPAIAAWNDLSDGGFSAIPGVMATFTLLPLGVFALFNALQNRRGQLTSAAIALLVCVGLLAAVAGIEIQGNMLEAQYAAQP
jgi:hypothetical protein